MKKLIYVILLLVALCVAANASDIIVGTTFGDTAKRLTTVDYRMTQPVSKYWNTEAVFGVATGFEDFDQNTDLNKYSLSLGANLTSGDAVLAGGAVVSYFEQTDIDDHEICPGVYASLDFKINSNWFVQGKYTETFNSSLGGGWQGGLGYKF
jgi:hypothetical protein